MPEELSEILNPENITAALNPESLSDTQERNPQDSRGEEQRPAPIEAEEGKAAPVKEEASKVDPYARFNELAALLGTPPSGYTTRRSNAPNLFKKHGSLFVSQIREETIWGAAMNTGANHPFHKETLSIEETLAKIPDDKLSHAGIYIRNGDFTDEEFAATTKMLDIRENDIENIAAHPVLSWVTGLAAQATDPINYLIPGSVIWKSVARIGLLKKVAGIALANATATGIQEVVLHQNQLSRTAKESAYNVMSSAIIGGLLGTAISEAVRFRAISKRIKAESQILADVGSQTSAKELVTISNRAKADLTNELMGETKELKENGTLKDHDLANIPEAVRAAMRITPMNQLLTSPFRTAKYFSGIMLQNNFILNQHIDSRTSGASVERLIIHSKKKYELAQADVFNVFLDMNGIKGGIFKGTRAEWSSKGMNWAPYNEAMWHILSSGVQHENPHVNAGAKIYRDRIFDPIKHELIDLGVLPKDVTPNNAFNYIMTVYDKELIKEQGGRAARGAGTFPQAIFDSRKNTQREIKLFKESPQHTELTSDIKNITNDIEKETLANKKRKLNSKPNKVKIKESAKKIKDLKEKLKESHLRFKNAAPKYSIDSKGKLRDLVNDETLWGQVENTVDKILGHQDGVLLNPFLSKLTGAGGKPLKGRTIGVDQLDLSEWHIKDVSHIADMYVRATVPFIEMEKLARRHGAKDLLEFSHKIDNALKKEYHEASKGLTGKAVTKLDGKLKLDQKNITDTIDMLMGVYGLGPNVLSNGASKFYRAVLAWDATRLLGNMLISSIPDVALHSINGTYKPFHHGILRMSAPLKHVLKKDLRAISYGIESELGSRIKSFLGSDSLSTSPSKFSRMYDKGIQAFGNASGISYWNSMHQNFAGGVSINSTLETIAHVMEGKAVTEKEKIRLAKYGISLDDYKTIYKHTKDNIDPETGVRYADWGNWDIKTPDDARVLKQFQMSVGQEIDDIIIVPSLGDKPRMAHKPLGKFLFQFKSFQLAANNKLAISALVQRRGDANMWVGVVSLLSLGALSYIIKSYIKGREPDLSFTNLVTQAVTQSGVLGILDELGSITAKGLGLPGVPRYESKGVADSLLGPAFSGLKDIIDVVTESSLALQGTRNITTKDIARGKRLFPYFGLFYIDWLTSLVFKGVGKSLGATERLGE